MNSAALGADVVDAVLRDPARARALYRDFERTVRRGVSTFSWLIYRMTNPVIRKLFLAPRNFLGVQSAVVSLLAGDVFRSGPVRPRLYLFRVIYYAQLHRPVADRVSRLAQAPAGHPRRLRFRNAGGKAVTTMRSLADTVVLIPAFNEVATIRGLVKRALRVVPDVIVVDDGSTDGTGAQLVRLPITLLVQRAQPRQGGKPVARHRPRPGAGREARGHARRRRPAPPGGHRAAVARGRPLSRGTS